MSKSRSAMDEQDIMKLGAPVSEAEEHVFAATKTGPFAPTIRIRCPLLNFSHRRTQACVGCQYYTGLRQRIIHGQFDAMQPDQAARAYMIRCGYPVTRGLVWMPED